MASTTDSPLFETSSTETDRPRLVLAGCAEEVCSCARPCATAAVSAQFMSIGESFRFERGDLLWDVGDAADSLIVPCVGHLMVGVRQASGQVNLEIVSRGGMFGEEAAVADSLRPVFCMALSNGRGVRLSFGKLRSHLRDRPDLRIHLLELSTTRTGRYAERISRLGEGTVKQRMAQVLVGLADQLGVHDGRGCFIPIRLRRSDLAEFAGCRPETAIRMLSQWRREGLVDCRREGIAIADRGLLAEHLEAG